MEGRFTKKNMQRLYNILLKAVLLVVCLGCSEINKVPDESFAGTWELTGRKIYQGIHIRIEKEGDEFVGRIVKLNDNKYVNLLTDSNAVWVSGVKRLSNYQFRLTENKIGKELFSVYELPTSQEFEVEFIDENSFALGKNNADPLKSAIVYRRVR